PKSNRRNQRFEIATTATPFRRSRGGKTAADRHVLSRPRGPSRFAGLAVQRNLTHRARQEAMPKRHAAGQFPTADFRYNSRPANTGWGAARGLNGLRISIG